MYSVIICLWMTGGIIMTDTKRDGQNLTKNFMLGVIFTFIIAGLGFLLSLIPGLDHIGQLACAILLAVIYRQIFGYPNQLKQGIVFTQQKLLRLAIILYGLKLNVDAILHHGLMLIVKDAVIIAFAILAMIILSNIFKTDKMITLLLGIGTGVCGAAAIAAIAPIVKSKDEDTAISVGLVALVGTIFGIGYTLLQPLLPISNQQYGIWSGSSLHEIAHVAIAAGPLGDHTIAIAMLAKLGRVFLLVPLAFIFLVYMKKKNQRNNKDENTRIQFPWFLIGFILMSVIATYVLGKVITLPHGVMSSISQVTTWLLTAAMVGLGLNVNLQDVKDKAFKPLLIMICVSVCVSILAYLLI